MNPIYLALLAYGWWGVVPLFWKHLAQIPSEELILYRILFSSLFLLPFLLPRSKQKILAALLTSPRKLAGLFLSGTLIGFNWYLYIWAVNHDFVVQSSLGYFINPLVNVALGTIVLGERMRPLQKIACLVAAIGVVTLSFATGAVPWIALLLAFSFAFYGLTRKLLNVPTVAGTFIETVILSLPSAFVLIWLGESGVGITSTSREWVLLAFSGVVTTVPLLAFAEAARSMPLSVLGFFQFISPSIQFLLGVFVFLEPFAFSQWLAFILIWLGLGVFLADLARQRSRTKQAVTPSS